VGGGGDYITTYTYDLLNHLAVVSMPRPTGTQTRTFNYGSPAGALLLSATNPENGTVSYTYNSYNKIATKTDAKGQQTQYTYDGYLRLTQVRHLRLWI
jgi:YD repeat-containing protein